MASALFPDQREEWNLEKAFLRNRKILFLMYALVSASVLVLSNILSTPTLQLNYSRSVWIAACILMVFVNAKIVRYTMAACLALWYAYLIILSDFKKSQLRYVSLLEN